MGRGQGPTRRGPAELVESSVNLRADSVQRLRKVLVGFLLSHETRQSLCVNLAAWNPAAAGVPLSRVEDPVGDRHGGLHNSPEYNSSYPFSR